jgi:hypothetical protein
VDSIGEWTLIQQPYQISNIRETFFLQLVDIEYMQNKHYKGHSNQALPDMKTVIENDNSNVDIHLAFINHCNGGLAYLGQICQVHPLTVNCLGPSTTPLQMAEIVTHEMGHVLGKITSIYAF